MSQLTLNVDPRVVARAKRYAKKNGVSLSSMVENYLSKVSMPAPATALPPILRSLRGILREGDAKDYREYLAKKYL